MNLPKFTGTFSFAYRDKASAEAGKQAVINAAQPETVQIGADPDACYHSDKTYERERRPHILVVTNQDQQKDAAVFQWLQQAGGSGTYYAKPTEIRLNMDPRQPVAILAKGGKETLVNGKWRIE